MGLIESLRAMEIAPLAASTPGNDERVDGFTLELQKKENWCWAAVAVSVARHLGSLPFPTQCRLVERVRPACGQCRNALCDVPGDVVRALREQNVVTIAGNPGAPTLDAVLQELHQEQPVICKVLKDPGEPASLPHFVVIVRAHRDSSTVKVLDPGKDKFYEKRWGFDRFAAHCQEHYIL
jgi:hypothetical protein